MEDKKDYDYINPNHYKRGSKEVWEMMVDVFGVEKFIAHCEMCAFKYRMRLGSKPDQPIERDLDKAKWYEDKAQELRDWKDPKEGVSGITPRQLKPIVKQLEFCEFTDKVGHPITTNIEFVELKRLSNED